jgi:hypothetical protein
MGSVKITTKESTLLFNPIKVEIEMIIESREELHDLLAEFEDGVFSEITTQRSNLLYDLLVKIRDHHPWVEPRF